MKNGLVSLREGCKRPDCYQTDTKKARYQEFIRDSLIHRSDFSIESILFINIESIVNRYNGRKGSVVHSLGLELDQASSGNRLFCQAIRQLGDRSDRTDLTAGKQCHLQTDSTFDEVFPGSVRICCGRFGDY